MTTRSCKLSRVIAMTLLLAVPGCGWYSTNPLYLPSDIVNADVLIGKWQGDFELESVGPADYRLTWKDLKDDNLNRVFHERTAKVKVLKLGDHYFADISNGKGHLFCHLSLLGNTLYVRNMMNSSGVLQSHLEQHPNELDHRMELPFVVGRDGKPSNRKTVVLTADTKELQSFVLKYVNDPFMFYRVRPKTKEMNIPIEESGLASKKYRTFSYWYELRMGTRTQLSRAKGKHLKEQLKLCEELADEISNMPTLGVDRAAAKCGASYAHLLRRMVEVDGGKLDLTGKQIEAAFRAIQGDLFGPINEIIEADKQVEKEIKELMEEASKARLDLTDRYEMEFPPLFR